MKCLIFVTAFAVYVSSSFAMEASLPLADCRECQLLLASQGNLINAKGKLNSSNITNLLGAASGGGSPVKPPSQGVNK